MAFEKDPQWYKDAVIYEVHVRTFYDSDGDGVGDFCGLKQKLDYLQDLGITAIWLLPFYPSPLRDDGYDIADYRNVHPDYGTLEDFKAFLDAAHRRGIRVITELVVNHTSDKHPWFQLARQSPVGSPERDFYVWSDDPNTYAEARIIFQDFENSNWAWDPVAKAYYWHRFYSHQPDLNFDNPAVKKALFEVLDYWLEMGVDGMRLDAVPYLYEREGTNCENLPETHAFLKQLRAHVDANFEDRMLLAEANQWPEDAAEYFGDGDECHMNYHFPVMPRLFLALQQEDRFPIVDILEQTPEIPDTCQWAVFLRNHDELTLEMVTDEERDFMYRAYAREARARVNLGIRRRLAPLMNNDRRRIELMNALLFALPGTPVLYYGDEIGMGDNIFLGDRNGVRTPMQWSGDRNAGFSRTNPQQLYLPVIIDPEYSYETINVEVQQANPSSLFWWTKRLLAMRKRHAALARGSLRILRPDNRKVLVFLREYEGEKLLIIANLSRSPNYVELDLSEFQGMVPVELFGRTLFPPIGELPYFLTLGTHGVYWFALEEHEDSKQGWALEESSEPVNVTLYRVKSLEEALSGRSRARIEGAMADFLRRQRWFASKGTFIRDVNFQELIPIALDQRLVYLSLVEVETENHHTEVYVVPLALAMGDHAAQAIQRSYPIVARLRFDAIGEEGVLYDAIVDPEFTRVLFDILRSGKPRQGQHGALVSERSDEFWELLEAAESIEPQVMQTEQSNTSVVYGDRLIFKLFRKLEPGGNLDAEIGRYLTDKGFEHAPKLAGQFDYRTGKDPIQTLGIMQEFIANEGDAWTYTLDELDRFYDRVVTRAHRSEYPQGDITTDIDDLIGSYPDAARLLGQRTADLHHALAQPSADPNFGSEGFSKLYQRSQYQSMRNLTGRVLAELRKKLDTLPDALRPVAQRLLDSRDLLHRPALDLLPERIDAMRIRTHGDFHLGQVLHTGKDFIITDFEGEPARPVSERRIRRSPLRDVAGMIRSFHYAAHFALSDHSHQDLASVRDTPLQDWGSAWFAQVRTAYLNAYLDATRDSKLRPASRELCAKLLNAYEVEKMVYELGYELNNRPDWLALPLNSLAQYLDECENS
ncbi:maltose alpha-D-glucosyltransferase [Bradymonas sediminis]|uniref:Maltokinase n=1 Tax=Bradymonas sediminis TaxID=1548548 RepID=A0A2Z4FHL0_9DELT|nr:maltose alpha-D-glucosyltransferase [Bradymonas sediminis]AWV88492.1 maltose alpha-D-glucosyltransferase [Bradymonas sediminis]TDP77625.1 maltose alpha-D-glucosyltransferase/alpha-amylase [Bradymonas sediminis]